MYTGSAGSVQLIADVSGYYLVRHAPCSGASSSPTPFPDFDTRGGLWGSVLAPGTLSLLVDGRAAYRRPAAAQNLAVTEPTGVGT